MKSGAEFFKATLIGGLVALVPVALLVFLVTSVVPVVIEVAAVLERFLPFGAFWNLLIATVGSALILLAICFFTGLALLTGPGDALRRKVNGLLERIIPLYGAARRLAERMTGTDGDDFLPVTVDLSGAGALSLGFLIENVPGDRCAVFIPMAPMPAMGNVVIVDRARVERIHAPMPEAFGVISEWGVGSGKLLDSVSVENPPDNAS